MRKALLQLSKKHIVVAGDVMLDSYTKGKAGRISPEAPVAVVHVIEDHIAPGGAGNVALNLKALGAEVTLLSRIGQDDAGKSLINHFRKDRVSIEGVFVDPDFITPVKNRVVAGGQQVLRIDREDKKALSPWLEDEILKKLPDILKTADLIALSDYGKGFLTKKCLQALIKTAAKLEIPIIADPKGEDFSKYHQVTLLKPNKQEAYLAAGLGFDADLQDVAKKLIETSKAHHLLITLSENGMALFEDGSKMFHLPVKAHEVKDVTGAGDTTLAVLSLAMANRVPLREAAELANLAAGIAIERFGCARVDLGDLVDKLRFHKPGNKIFEKHHLFCLEKLLEKKDYQIFKVEANKMPSLELFREIRELASKTKFLVLNLDDYKANSELLDFVVSLSEVDAVVLGKETSLISC